MPPVPRPAGRTDPLGAPWPGLIPLRPLAVSEILTTAAAVVRAHAVVLCGLAFAGAVVSGGITLAVLSGFADRSAYFSADWLEKALTGEAGIPAVVLWPLLASAVFSLLVTTSISGLATVFATDGALARPSGAASVKSRLGGRWWILLAVGLLTSVAVFLGAILLVLPGLIAFAAFGLAVPVAAMEGAGPLASMRRAARLARGSMLRIFSVLVLAIFLSSLISTLVTSIASPSADLTGVAISLGIAALVSAITTPWTSAVIALLYIDTRIRREDLAKTLLRSVMQP